MSIAIKGNPRKFCRKIVVLPGQKETGCTYSNENESRVMSMDNVIFCDLCHGEHILAMKTRQGTMENISGTDRVCASSKCIFSSSWLLFWVTARTVELIEKFLFTSSRDGAMVYVYTLYGTPQPELTFEIKDEIICFGQIWSV